ASCIVRTQRLKGPCERSPATATTEAPTKGGGEEISPSRRSTPADDGRSTGRNGEEPRRWLTFTASNTDIFKVRNISQLRAARRPQLRKRVVPSRPRSRARRRWSRRR